MKNHEIAEEVKAYPISKGLNFQFLKFKTSRESRRTRLAACKSAYLREIIPLLSRKHTQLM